MLGATDVPPVLADLVEPVGVVPDEVLLRCGKLDSTPSGWWTPWLDEAVEEDVAALRAAADEFLVEHGLLTDDGCVTGLLGEVAAIVREADRAVLIEHDDGDQIVRLALLVTEHRALVDEQDAAIGVHHLCIASPAGAVALLVGILDPRSAAVRGGPLEVLDPDELVRRWPPTARVATTRLIEVDRVHDTTRVVTVLEDDDGLGVAWALDDGRVAAGRLSAVAVVEFARVLLGAEED